MKVANPKAPAAESATQRALAKWSRSCAESTDGLCVTRESASASHCGPDSARALVVRARSAEATSAQAELAAAVARREQVTYELSGRERQEYASAKLALADAELEHYLGIAGPTGLDFVSKKDASVQQFDTWIRTKTELGKNLRDRYEAIVAMGGTAAVIAASRIGTIAASFSEQLYTMEIPVDVRSGEFAEEKVDAFCDTLTTAAEPLDTQAVDAFASCVAKARDYSGDVSDVFTAVRPCLDALAQLRPETFPSLDEVFVAAEEVRMRLRLGPVDVDNLAGATDYDRLNTRGVALRVQGDFAGARAAYASAIALDDKRPEAHFNLALLETFEANKVDLGDAPTIYQRAAESFERAIARSTGTLRDDATSRTADVRKVIRQLDAFIAESRR